MMEQDEGHGGIVEFSVDKVRLVNDGKERHKATFYVQNRCSASRKIRVAVGKYSDPVFRLLSGYNDCYLAAGLKFPVVLQYTPRNDRGIGHHGELDILVEDKLVKTVPIQALPPSPHLEVSPNIVDFGSLVAEHQIVTRSFTISNAGAREGGFQVNTLPPHLTIAPVEGRIKPGEKMDLKVELLSKETGAFLEAMSILSEDGSAELFTVTLCGNIQHRQLELLDPSDPDSALQCVTFGHTYYGTVLTRRGTLYNNSPVETEFIAVLDSEAVGGTQGVDKSEGLAMACTGGGLGQDRWREQGNAPSGETLVNVTPMQGSLGPYEKRTVEFSFAPTFLRSVLGWTHHQGLPSQRSYALFVKFVHVRAHPLGEEGGGGGSGMLEVAVTGTAMPVDLRLEPGSTLDFGHCITGSTDTQQIQLCNYSDVLPIDFCCHQLAHYKCSPSAGRIRPGEGMQMNVAFLPKQFGPLNFKLQIDVMGSAGGASRRAVVYTAVVELRGRGTCAPVGKRERREGVAHPDDLATSVRPHDGNTVVVTPYTHVPRHTYVDADYTYADEDRARHKCHRDTYTQYIRQRHEERMWRRKERAHSNPAYHNSTDLAIPPAQGFHPPKLSIPKDPNGAVKRSAQPSSLAVGGEGSRGRMLTTRDLMAATAAELQVVEWCASKPSSPEMATECGTHLSPEQLSQIMIDPFCLDFGRVVVGSSVERHIAIKNFLHKHISIRMKVAGTELHCPAYPTSHSSHLTLIVPPSSHAQVPFTLHQSTVGTLERSLEYSINSHHAHHIPVKADVVRLSLKLSTNTLSLTEPYLSSPTVGLHGSVLVSNEHSVPAHFQWHAQEGTDTDTFYMMHPTGVVPPHSSLECEFICQPSFNSPNTAQFMLGVEGEDGEEEEVEGEKGGKEERRRETPAPNVLSLVAQFGQPSCCFREKRVLFSTVPLNLTTMRTVHLENTGDCHAYFQVVDPSPYAGMQLFPRSGCVPVGGAAELQVVLHPTSVDRFDVKVGVELRSGKKVGIRMAGAVEHPIIAIDKELFRFGGVYCGARATIPFTVTNKASTRAQLTFDLSFMSDFSLVLPSQEEPYGEVTSDLPTEDYPGVYSLSLPGKTSVDCKLEFCPNNVAAYDFHLPVLVNGQKPPSPPPSPWPPSRIPSKINVRQGPSTASFSLTPTRRVLATALRSPLLISPTELRFTMGVRYLETVAEPIQHQQVINLTNVGEEPLTWALDCAGVKRLEDDTFKFVFPRGTPLTPPTPTPSPGPREGEIGYLKPGQNFEFTVQCKPAHHGSFTASIPLIVNNNLAQPYRMLMLTAELAAGRITVSPTHIAVQPVPLGVSVTAQFLVSVQGFAGPVNLEASLPPVESHVHCAIHFPEGSQVTKCLQEKVDLPCTLEFSSTEPVSKTDYITFSDRNTGKRRRVPFTVAADNCIFTVYEFLTQNLNSASIRGGKGQGPTLILQELTKGLTHASSESSVSLSSVGEGRVSFTASSTFGEMFLQDCISGMCRWLSVYGWAEGVKCVVTPVDLRKKVGHDLPKAGVKQRSSLKVSRGMLVDLLTHICGRLPPGVPLNPRPCSTPSEKVNQEYSTFATVLAFIKSQGGLLWSLVPESLLDYQDYQQWVCDGGGVAGSVFHPGSEEEFLEASRLAWTHLLMQIIKVLVLPRVMVHLPRPLLQEVSGMDPLASNIYSRPERTLLAWLNHHHQQQRNNIFRGQDLLEREVVNFEVDLMDCTVLACAVTAYCPYLVSSHFVRLFAEPSSPEQCSHNAVVLVEALRDVGLDYDCQPSDLCSPNPVFMLLFCYHLYNCLPTFRPAAKSAITLEGTLHSTVTQQVHLQNPSGKPLVYKAMIRGGDADDFSIDKGRETITLPGRQHTSIDVSFSARHLLPSSATLLLVARGGRATAGATLAFTLQASVAGANPQLSTCITAALYEPQEVVLEVRSLFLDAGDFEIRLYESGNNDLLHTASSKSRRRCGPRAPATILTSSMQERSTDKMQLFNPMKSMVHLQPGQPAPVRIRFVPLKMEPRYCVIVLSNAKLGEVVLSIAATVKLPCPVIPHSQFSNPHTVVNRQTRTIHLKAHAGQTVEEEIVIYSRNIAFEDAMLVISRWGMSDVELKRRHLSESLRYATLSTAVATLGLDDRPKTYKDITEDANKLVFSVEGGDEYFSLPEVVAVPADPKGRVVLPVKFHADEEGQYECHVVLQSEYDVRVLVIESTVQARGRHAELEFRTPAMQPLMQEIPLVNPSTVDWPLQAAVNGAGFSGPETIVVKALTTTCYPLTFNPHKEGLIEGDLHLVNTNDGTENIFQLRGMAERPLAQDHITLHAQAKRSLTHILHVPNHNERTTLFRVESDLDFISGPSTITIGGGDVVDYPLTVLPRRQGAFSGAVAFVAQAVSKPQSFEETLTTPTSEGAPHHIWFHIDCNVEPAPPDHVIPVSCHTLSSTTLHLTVVNPHPQPLTLEVLVEGHGLSGPDRLEVELCGEASYPLTFTPTTVGKTQARVVFNGSPDGEVWYLLHLTALDPKPMVLPEIQCELGRTCHQHLCLSNPLDHPVVFSCQCTNTRHFIVTGLSEGQVTVDPGSSAEVSVLFKPSALGAGEHTAEVSFTSGQFGVQVFTLTGRGLPPTAMDPTTITASLSSNTVHILSFTNPLDTPSHYSISLQGADLEHFCLLLKRTQAILLHSGVSLDIPVMFAPESMCRHNVTVVVSAEGRDSSSQSPLSWQYPIIGQPVVRPSSPTGAPRLNCCAKERLEQSLEVSLVASTSSQVVHVRAITPGSKPGTPETSHLRDDESQKNDEKEAYSYQLVCSDRKFAPLVELSTGIKLLRRVVNEDNPFMVNLVFGLVFVPPKAFSCMSELQVTSSRGGVWRFPLHLSATSAAPDDIITVEARGLNKETQVGFRLTSMAEHPIPFTAHLAAGSDPELSVHPTSGELAPINTRGTLFCITYRPTTYGRDHHARLIVQCDSSEWCYKIVGQAPSYTPPTHTPSRVQHKVAPSLLRVPQTKNFVRENMKLLNRIGVK